MSVEQQLKAWERIEKEDWRLVVPLQGIQKHNANILNPTAGAIYDLLTKKSFSIGDVTKKLCEQYPQESGIEIENDVINMALKLQDIGVYSMNTNELKALRTREALISGLHVMRELEIEDVTRRLKKCLFNVDGKCKDNIMYSMLRLHPSNLKPHVIRNLHFRSEQVFFVSTDCYGKAQGVISLYQPSKMSVVKHIGLFVVFEDKSSEIRIKKGIEILTALEQFASNLFSAKKMRLILQEYSEEAETSVLDFNILSNWDNLSQIITRCGYRNEAELVDEFGPGVNAKYYYKTI